MALHKTECLPPTSLNTTSQHENYIHLRCSFRCWYHYCLCSDYYRHHFRFSRHYSGLNEQHFWLNGYYFGHDEHHGWLDHFGHYHLRHYGRLYVGFDGHNFGLNGYH
ncbi:hypothetical protein GCM10011383_27690 [Hymenobacter cavernae]|uniref:Uncharacterized protein n=1 Tax=Hymenobacter cavernae TaxID=2044852 RepID=A0ABQ1UD91_9BACT|nr:hypothetical protein GCM10011383_27690 [Hymenobacter cavernae]